MNEIDIGRIWPGWEIAGLLGRGAFGAVYLATGTIDGGKVYGAVKVIKTPPTAAPVEAAKKNGISEHHLKTYFSKFKNDLSWELTMYRAMICPALAPVDDLVVEDDPVGPGWTGYIRTALYTPMDVYFGEKPATPAEVLRLGRELCAALEKYEGFGVQHGDIRPENVLVDDAGGFLLGDFGVRRCLEKAGAGVFGDTSSEFDAPELSGTKKYTARTDIYSLGMLLSYAAGGCALGADDGLREEAPELAEVVQKATAPAPEERYSSAAELRAALEKVDIRSTAPRRAKAVARALGMTAPKKERPAKAEERAEPLPPAQQKMKNRVVEAIAAAILLIVLAAILFITKPWDTLRAPSDTPPTDPESQLTDTVLPE